jgi:hypothetical protein
MPDLTAKRTLVKSPPELWSELSEVERLASHLGAFGEITITKLEPEHTVAWEGEAASGTVSIEPSGWGTKVTLTARLPQATPVVEVEPAVEVEPEPVAEEPEPVVEVEPEPVAEEPPAPTPRRGFFARLFGRRPVEEPAAPEEEQPEVAPEPAVAVPEPTVVVAEPPPVEEDDRGALDHDRALAALEETLEALGSAHHRPFSRG